MDCKEAITREANRIAESLQLRNAPKQRELLLYLASHTGGTFNLTQNDIAAAILGKTSGFDERIDSSVRTHFTRLRKSLAAYYAEQEAGADLCIYIVPGEYRLRFAKREIAYPQFDGGKSLRSINRFETTDRDLNVEIESCPNNQSSNASKLWYVVTPDRAKLIGLCVVIICTLFFIPRFSSNETNAAIQNRVPSSVPLVALQVDASGLSRNRSTGAIEAKIASAATQVLRKSMVSRLAMASTEKPDFRVRVAIEENELDRKLAYVTLVDENNVLIHEKTLALSLDPILAAEQMRGQMQLIVSPLGPIADEVARMISSEPQNSFECFVAIENRRAKNSTIEQLTHDCVERFKGQEFVPYLEARILFAQIAKDRQENNHAKRGGEIWKSLSRLLEDYPDNSYGNMMASKLLAGQGRCAEALRYRDQALSRGATYVAMELSIDADILACSDVSPDQAHAIKSDVLRAAAIYTEPDPIVETYMLMALLSANELDSARSYADRPFARRDADFLDGLLVVGLHHGLDESQRVRLRTQIQSMLYNDAAVSRIMDALP